MSTVRAGQTGATRVCPHCKAIVLESAAVCPGCRHHLRFNSVGKRSGEADAYCALSIDGTIAHRQTGEPCEYCIVLDITNERGEQLVRQVVGVGALQPGELRRLNLSVDMLPIGLAASKAQSAPAAGLASTSSVPPGRPAVPDRAALAGRPGVSGPGGSSAAGPVSANPMAARGAGTGTGTGMAASRATGIPSAAQPAVTSPPMPPPRGPQPPAPVSMPAKVTAAAPPTAGATPKMLNSGPGGTLGQRLRIFRKP
ncbi:MAG TPA: hypothetical protein VHX52_00190 [Steroidobacteraceae bacterium]|jgi:hypothetical protein|nr:hypothetical protein [Steroidobacteraceae bacterium]